MTGWRLECSNLLKAKGETKRIDVRRELYMSVSKVRSDRKSESPEPEPSRH